MEREQTISGGCVKYLKAPCGVGVHLNPMRIACLTRMAGYHHKTLRRGAQDGDISLNPPLGIEELRVDGIADGHIHLRATDVV